MKLMIIGTGKMAEAIIDGVCKKYETTVVGRNSEKLASLSQKYGVVTQVMDDTVDIEGQHVMVCVKPYALQPVASKLDGKASVVMSVLAGTSINTLQNAITADHYIRIMPNLAAAFGKSMNTLCGDEAFKAEAIAICESFGRALWLGSEKEIDIATGIAGSGPAFLALVAEALADGAVKEGLKRDDATEVVRGLFDGFATLIENNHPALLKDAVMSSGGTTAAGYAVLEEGKVRDSFIKSVTKAYEKAKQNA